MHLESWGGTDVGLRREINQDSILVDKQLGLYVVADGMGGHKGGEVASAMAVDTIRAVVENEYNHSERIVPRELMRQAYQQASESIFKKSMYDSPELKGMGTTMVAALCMGSRAYIGNVGDSRAYLFKDKMLWQLTEDHSLINEQVKAGVINEDEAAYMAGRNVITRSVGFERDVSTDVIERELDPGDMLLLCSDGLSGLVSDRKIADTLIKTEPAKVVNECIRLAKAAGGDDNISVILILRTD